MTKSLLRLVLLGSAISAPGSVVWGQTPAPPTPSAPAETAPAAEASEPGVLSDEIVVTGTRIARPELDFANPVVTLSAEMIEQSGRTNLTDLLIQTPALIGSRVGDFTGGSNTDFGEAGLNLLNLRNLGENRTLVLVDGRRHVSSLAGTAAVDINMIPTDLIEAIDVLTGGASAIYGADGVSGVVNFRLKRDFEGISARGQIGISKYGDGGNRFGAVTVGKNFAEGRGNVALSYEYNADDRVYDQDRKRLREGRFYLLQNQDDLEDDPDVPDYIPYSNVTYADSSFEGAVDVDFDFASDFEGNGRVYDRGFILESSGGYAVGGSNTPLGGYQGDLFPGVDRHLVNLLSHYEFSDAFNVFAEAKYVNTKTVTLSQPTFDFYLFQTPENPFMPQSIRDAIVPGAAAAYFEDDSTPDGVFITRDNFDLGINTEDVERETKRGVIGATGALAERLKYEVSYVYGETKSRITSRNNRLEANWQAAIDVVTDPVTGQPVCRTTLDPDTPFPNCVPFNIYGHGVRSAAAVDFVVTDSTSRSKVTQKVLSGSLSGDFGGLFTLPGGNVGFALGAEYRKETSAFDPDPQIENGETWSGALQTSRGDFDVKEVFAELNAPLLKGMPFAHLLSVGAAIRYSDYSTVGGTKSWKVDGVYAPVSDISFRATYAVAVRAPNIDELFGPESSEFDFIVDPCDTQEVNNGSSTREANCAALLTALGVDPTTFSPSSTPQASLFTEGLSRGNVNLSEERAKTWTAGVVLRPSFLPGFSASADWYDIRIEDAINTAEANDLFELCVDQPTLDNPFCTATVRDPDTGFVFGFRSQPENVASFRTAGLDVTLAYRFSTARFGKFRLSLLGNYLDRLEFISSPGAEVDQDAGETYSPRYQASFDVSWELAPLTIAYSVSWFSKTDRYTREDLAGDPDYADPKYLKVKEKWEHDIQASLDVDDRFTFYGGVTNLFDEQPALDFPSYPVSALGRFFYVGAKVKLPSL